MLCPKISPYERKVQDQFDFEIVLNKIDCYRIRRKMSQYIRIITFFAFFSHCFFTLPIKCLICQHLLLWYQEELKERSDNKKCYLGHFLAKWMGQCWWEMEDSGWNYIPSVIIYTTLLPSSCSVQTFCLCLELTTILNHLWVKKISNLIKRIVTQSVVCTGHMVSVSIIELCLQLQHESSHMQ